MSSRGKPAGHEARARILRDGIPGSKLVVVPGAGHVSFVEPKDEYLSAVPFLRRSEDCARRCAARNTSTLREPLTSRLETIGMSTRR